MNETIEGCETINIFSFVQEGFISEGKKYRKDTGEEILIRKWTCPNSKNKSGYNWFQIKFLGYPEFEEHDIKAEYINNDNPNVVIM